MLTPYSDHHSFDTYSPPGKDVPLGSVSKSIVTFTHVGDVVGPGVEGGCDVC
jgi:hypothetical protein